MATYQIPPPEKFDFSHPEEWPKWIWRFERFRWASGLHGKGEESQVNMLTYTMDDILMSFGLSADDQKKYSTVKDKFENHFVQKRNIIFERAKFNQRKQEEGESVDTFITSLYTFYMTTWFGTRLLLDCEVHSFLKTTANFWPYVGEGCDKCSSEQSRKATTSSCTSFQRGSSSEPSRPGMGSPMCWWNETGSLDNTLYRRVVNVLQAKVGLGNNATFSECHVYDLTDKSAWTGPPKTR